MEGHTDRRTDRVTYTIRWSRIKIKGLKSLFIRCEVLLYFLMNVEDLKLINLDGEMLLKLDVILFILTDRLWKYKIVSCTMCQKGHSFTNI